MGPSKPDKAARRVAGGATQACETATKWGQPNLSDSFALILHLDDVYWEQEGRVSADAVLIAVAFMGACLVIASPGDPPGPPETDPYVNALIPVVFVLLWVLPIGVTISGSCRA